MKLETAEVGCRIRKCINVSGLSPVTGSFTDFRTPCKQLI